MYKLTIKLTEANIEAGELVVNVDTKGKASAIKEGTKNDVSAEMTKTVEL